jgi:hypothetical protein
VARLSAGDLAGMGGDGIIPGRWTKRGDVRNLPI